MSVALSSQTNRPAQLVLGTLASCHLMEIGFALSTERKLLLH